MSASSLRAKRLVGGNRRDRVRPEIVDANSNSAAGIGNDRPAQSRPHAVAIGIEQQRLPVTRKDGRALWSTYGGTEVATLASGLVNQTKPFGGKEFDRFADLFGRRARTLLGQLRRTTCAES